MKHLSRNIFLASCLLLIAGTVEAQAQSAAKPDAEMAPATNSGQAAEQQTVDQAIPIWRAKEPTAEMIAAQKALQTNQQQAPPELEKAEEAKAYEKERALEIDKPSNDEWRTRLEMKNAKYQNIAIPEEVPRTEVNAKVPIPDTNWKTLIQQTENELAQTNDPATRQKLQNKLTGLRKRDQEAQQSNIK